MANENVPEVEPVKPVEPELDLRGKAIQADKEIDADVIIKHLLRNEVEVE